MSTVGSLDALVEVPELACGSRNSTIEAWRGGLPFWRQPITGARRGATATGRKPPAMRDEFRMEGDHCPPVVFAAGLEFQERPCSFGTGTTAASGSPPAVPGLEVCGPKPAVMTE